MIIKKTIKSVQKYLNNKKSKLINKIAFIPTMGALHEGHLSLIKLAKERQYFIIVSIYVNPSQFDPNEDFSNYPRTLRTDLAKLKKLSVDLIFTPKIDDISKYTFKKMKYSTFGIENKLCGRFRPHHFPGVAEIVLKFLSILKPEVIYLGQKDYQQFFYLKRIIEQTNLPMKVKMGKTIREKSGLALSSRNKYLSKDEHEISVHLYKTLKETRLLIKNGLNLSSLLKKQKKKLLKIGFTKIDYLEVKRNDLKTSTKPHKKSRIFIAAHINDVRLIDNILI